MQPKYMLLLISTIFAFVYCENEVNDVVWETPDINALPLDSDFLETKNFGRVHSYEQNLLREKREDDLGSGNGELPEDSLDEAKMAIANSNSSTSSVSDNFTKTDTIITTESVSDAEDNITTDPSNISSLSTNNEVNTTQKHERIEQKQNIVHSKSQDSNQRGLLSADNGSNQTSGVRNSVNASQDIKQDQSNAEETSKNNELNTNANGILIFLIVAVVVVGVLAGGYKYYMTKKNKKHNAENIENEQGEEMKEISVVNDKNKNNSTLSNPKECQPLLLQNETQKTNGVSIENRHSKDIKCAEHNAHTNEDDDTANVTSKILQTDEKTGSEDNK